VIVDEGFSEGQCRRFEVDAGNKRLTVSNKFDTIHEYENAHLKQHMRRAASTGWRK
jgi:hypothetical protein